MGLKMSSSTLELIPTSPTRYGEVHSEGQRLITLFVSTVSIRQSHLAHFAGRRSRMFMWMSGRRQPRSDRLDATCRYRGIRHRRIVVFLSRHTVLIVDEVSADSPELLTEQFWHLGRIVTRISERCFEVLPRLS